jgi:hypothetical protein
MVMMENGKHRMEERRREGGCRERALKKGG